MLQLSTQQLATIAAHGVASYPYEGCGLLLGRREGDVNVVTAIKLMENVWPNVDERRERFRIDPQAWLSAELQAALDGVDIIGIFHSHPDHPPVASPRDLQWASWPGYSYLITEIRDGAPLASRSWQLAADRSGFDEEPVQAVAVERS